MPSRAILRLLVTAGLVVAGCGPASENAIETSGKMVGGIDHSEPLMVIDSVVDATGDVWTLGQLDSRVVLSANSFQETDETSTVVGPATRFGSIGMILVAEDTDGVVLAAVHCESGDSDPETCADPKLYTMNYTLDDGGITTVQWAEPVSVKEPTAVTLAGRAPGSLAFRSGDVIVSETGTIKSGPESSLQVCAQDGSFVSGEYLTNPERPPSTMPKDGAPVNARLNRYDDGTWNAIEGSEISFLWNVGNGLDFRCGSHGIEVAEEGQPARFYWSESDWRETNAGSVSWMTYDGPLTFTIIPNFGRFGIVGLDSYGDIIQVDSATGAVSAEVTPPTSIDHWWDRAINGVRLGVFALGEVDGSVIAVSCALEGAKPATCDIWSGD